MLDIHIYIYIYGPYLEMPSESPGMYISIYIYICCIWLPGDLVTWVELVPFLGWIEGTPKGQPTTFEDTLFALRRRRTVDRQTSLGCPEHPPLKVELFVG